MTGTAASVRAVDLGIRYADDSSGQSVELRGVLLYEHFECLEVVGLGLPNAVQGSLFITLLLVLTGTDPKVFVSPGDGAQLAPSSSCRSSTGAARSSSVTTISGSSGHAPAFGSSFTALKSVIETASADSTSSTLPRT
ncbi:MAG: hypothetical protein QOI85_2221 [Chloroflexota bacterium]|nr:hypothetical protein [Chloroflexota bacterium]